MSASLGPPLLPPFCLSAPLRSYRLLAILPFLSFTIDLIDFSLCATTTTTIDLRRAT